MAHIVLFTIVLSFSHIFSVSCGEIKPSKFLNKINQLIKHAISHTINADNLFASNITKKSLDYDYLAKFWDGIRQFLQNIFQKGVNQYAKGNYK